MKTLLTLLVSAIVLLAQPIPETLADGTELQCVPFQSSELVHLEWTTWAQVDAKQLLILPIANNGTTLGLTSYQGTIAGEAIFTTPESTFTIMLRPPKLIQIEEEPPQEYYLTTIVKLDTYMYQYACFKE